MSTITTGFTEDLRYKYDLNENSRVIDCGFYQGDFAIGISFRYNCHIEAYEPIKEFFNEGLVKVLNYPKIVLLNQAVSEWNSRIPFKVKGGMSGWFADEGVSEDVLTIEIADVIKDENVDLLKLNIEGMEFEVLESMIRNDLVYYCKNIQVQFHPVVPDCENRYNKIRSELLETHRLTFDFPWVWENYERID